MIAEDFKAFLHCFAMESETFSSCSAEPQGPVQKNFLSLKFLVTLTLVSSTLKGQGSYWFFFFKANQPCATSLAQALLKEVTEI